MAVLTDVNTDVQGIYLTYFIILFTRDLFNKALFQDDKHWLIKFDHMWFVLDRNTDKLFESDLAE